MTLGLAARRSSEPMLKQRPKRMAHTVKGVAGNLGAKLVQAVAGELGRAIKEGTPPPGRWLQPPSFQSVKKMSRAAFAMRRPGVWIVVITGGPLYGWRGLSLSAVGTLPRNAENEKS